MSFSDSPVLFDIDHDGKKELTGWMSAQDGIVVMDLNNNGQIDDIHETFSEYFNGTVGTNGEAGIKNYANGFAALTSLDSNGDNRFTNADTAWNNVRVWQDADQDGKSDPGELKRLNELGITLINLSSASESGLVNGGNEVLALSTFIQYGQTKEALAVRFIANPIGNTSTISAAGTVVAAEDGQSTYVSGATTGENIDVAQKGVTNAYGNIGNDTLIGNALDNWLVGGEGSDTFNAGAGDDMLIIDSDDLQENIHAGEGFDMLQVVGSEGVTINLTQSEVEVAVGGTGEDIIIGGGRSSVFVQGGEGDDILIGGASNDSLSAQKGADLVDGGAGTDIQAELRGQVYLKTSEMPVDSLFTDEWYLSDINILPVWKDAYGLGYSGLGVRIGQFEPGMPFSEGAEVFDYRHSDLQKNVDAIWLSDPDNDIPESFSEHATLVAGVMVGALDGEAAVGVAYDATLAGFYVGETLNQNTPYQIEVDFNNLYKLAEFDVSNNSWGYGGQFEYFTLSEPKMADEFFKPAIEFGRKGLGSNIVMAGGNSRQTAGNTNASELTANRYVIVTGAINAESDISTLSIGQAPFSNPGASILVSAPGSNVASTSSILINADGTVFGNNTSTAEGTSFATPIVTGIIALMLEANPKLGYRDVQQILALSAKKVNDPNSDTTYNGATNWNGGGMHVSHDYGFGEVDARTAVRLAEKWVSFHNAYNERHLSNGEGSSNGGTNLAIAITDGTTVTRSITLGAGLRAEHVELSIDIVHNNINDLTVELVSPAGTVSKLVANPGKGPVSNPDMQMRQLEFTFDTTQDWGENVAGNWQLRIIDRSGLGSGVLNGWKIDAYGCDLNETFNNTSNVAGQNPVVSSSADNIYFFTDEFASSPGLSRSTINDTNGGLDIINAAAVSTGSSINLTNGATSVIGGRNLTLSGDIEFAFGGDGNDTITGNTCSNRLSGGRGNDSINGGEQMDLLDGGQANDMLTGGSGNDYFIVCPAANSVDTITDFSPGTSGEKILLVGFDNVTDFSQITLSQEGSNTRLNLGGGQSLLLQNIAPSQISEQNFGCFSDMATLEWYASYLSSSSFFSGSSGVENGLIADNLGKISYFALGGADAIGGTAPNDLIDGGDGNDSIWGDYPGYTITPGADWLEGGAGNDYLFGGAGDDMLLGGSGNDNLQGEAGKDVLRGASGADSMNGGDGDDLLLGGAGNDFMDGGNGNDVLFLEGDWGTVSGTNYLYYGTRVGGAGADTFVFTANGGGNGSLVGSAGQISTYNLVADFNPAQEGEIIDMTNLKWIHGFGDLSIQTMIINGTTFTRITASDDTNQLCLNLQGVSSDTLHSGHFKFNANPGIVFGTETSDTLNGNAGGNTLNGGAEADTMTGRTGDDTYIIDNAGDRVNELPDGGFDTVKSSISYVLTPNVENLELTGSSVINGTGNDLQNRLTGNASANVLDGGTGADTMLGKAGNDTYVIDNQSDTVIEHSGEGTDTVLSSVSYTLGTDIEYLTLTGSDAINATGNSLSNLLYGNAGDNFIDGSSGADTMAGGEGDDTYIVDNGSDLVIENENAGYDTLYAATNYTLSANVENLLLCSGVISGTGNSLDNWLKGNKEANILTGGGGNDTLDGDTGTDTLVGGTGDDTYPLDSPFDKVIEMSGEGNDSILASVSITLETMPNVENVLLSTGTENLNATGNSNDNLLAGQEGRNLLTGLAGNDTLDGGGDVDTLIGGFGDDSYVVDNTSDIVTENSGEGLDSVFSSIDYTLGPNVENLTLTGFADLSGTGNSLNNTLKGNIANNTLTGGVGNDTIEGGGGDDLLIGGAGNDVYHFLTGFGQDMIRENDWTVNNNDRIVFEADIAVEQVNVSRNGMDLLLSDTASNTLRVEGWFTDDAHKMERIEFTNGPTWTVTDLRMKTNLAPFASTALDNQNVKEKEWFLYVVPVNAVIDNDAIIGDTLSYAATLANGNPLPNWLHFDSATRTFSGTPTNSDVGSMNIKVTAKDLAGANTSSSFSMTVTNVNDAPTLANAIPDQKAIEDSPFILTLPPGTFVDIDAGDVLSCNATLADGTALPNWLSFDSTTCTLSGTPESASSEHIKVRFTATDLHGAMTNAEFKLNIANHIVGSATANNLVGTVFYDVIEGMFGNDTLNGGGGADTLNGGPGNDLYIVDNTNVVVNENTDEGLDLVMSSVSFNLRDNIENLILTGRNTIDGTGNSLDNCLCGNSSKNILIGGLGNDTLIGGGGADTMIGGIGHDSYFVNNTDVVVKENADEGVDLVMADVSWTLNSNIENLTLTGLNAIDGTGNSLNNVLCGNSSENILIGGLGYDLLNGGGGDDTLAGGPDNDIYIVENTNVVVKENVNEGSDIVMANISWTLDANIETLILKGLNAIDGTGNSLNNGLCGNSSDNILIGGLGDDTLDGGGGGADTLIGGAGDDRYSVYNTNAVVKENANEGIDIVISKVSFAIGSNIENLMLKGFQAINGTGNSLNNCIYGDINKNILIGGMGNDTLLGGGGADTLIGGTGDDIYIVNNTGVVMKENANEGTDLLMASVSSILGENIENLTLTSSKNIQGIGNSLNNYLTGNSFSNVLDGGSGYDTLLGGAGDDIFHFTALREMGVNRSACDVIADFSKGDLIDISSLDANIETIMDDAFSFIGNSPFDKNNATGQLRYNSDTGMLIGSVDSDPDPEFAIEITCPSIFSSSDFIL